MTSIPAITAPFLAASAILAVAGVAKVARPYDTARALRAAGWPAGKSWVRVGSLAEIVVGATAIVVPSPVTGALVALSYASFAVFVTVALRRGWVLSSCGCFGKADTRPTCAHAALNAGAAAVAGLWSASGPDHLRSVILRTQWHGAALGITASVIAVLAYFVWTNPVPSAR